MRTLRESVSGLTVTSPECEALRPCDLVDGHVATQEDVESASRGMDRFRGYVECRRLFRELIELPESVCVLAILPIRLADKGEGSRFGVTVDGIMSEALIDGMSIGPVDVQNALDGLRRVNPIAMSSSRGKRHWWVPEPWMREMLEMRLEALA